MAKIKLKDYISHLNEMIKSNPEIADFELVYSKDSEGNEFKFVYNLPEIGIIEQSDFVSINQFDEFGYSEGDENCVCVN